MNIEWLQAFCTGLPGTGTSIKWENNLVFTVGDKMYCIADLEGPLNVSMKLPEGMLEEAALRPGFRPAPYLAKAGWVQISPEARLPAQEWEALLRQSYSLVCARLPLKVRKALQEGGSAS